MDLPSKVWNEIAYTFPNPQRLHRRGVCRLFDAKLLFEPVLTFVFS